MTPVYTTTATAWGGRAGRVASEDGVIDIELAVPKEMGGPGGDHSNPEQLFASGYAACFHGALKLVASREKVDASDSAVSVTVGIGDNGEGGFQLSAKIEAEIAGLDEATVKSLVEKAHQVCPYSNATRGNIDVELGVIAS